MFFYILFLLGVCWHELVHQNITPSIFFIFCSGSNLCFTSAIHNDDNSGLILFLSRESVNAPGTWYQLDYGHGIKTQTIKKHGPANTSLFDHIITFHSYSWFVWLLSTHFLLADQRLRSSLFLHMYSYIPITRTLMA